VRKTEWRTETEIPVFGTYAWAEYLRESRKGKIVKRLIESGRGFTPSIVLAEITRKYFRETLEKIKIND